MYFARSIALLFVFATLCTDIKAEETPVAYEVDLSSARNHYITVSANVKATGDSTELMLPVWTPGSYLVREYARHIDSFVAKDEQGNALSYDKTRKNRWTVASKGVERVVVTYRVYCNELSVRTNFVDNQFALLNGAPTFVTVPKYRESEHHVKLMLPRKWKRTATSLQAGDAAHVYVAETYDELVDSPIVAGNICVYPFEVAGVRHELVNVGEAGYWNGNQAAADLAKVVAAHHELWGEVPYSRYSFINVICGRGGGLEHDNSTVMLTRRWSFRDKDRYLSWLSLASHEFFHTWNVRRLRPKALMKYDYENEVYTPSLWIAEGITSYYEDLLLVRAGLMDEDEFLDRLSGNISSVQNRPGRLVQSLKESSLDSWIKFYRPSDNSGETQISYYSKGAVVGLLLDTEIRAMTTDKSLDDVMRRMYREFSKVGYRPNDFRKTVSDVCGSDVSAFFEKYVDSTAELNFSKVKSHFGLRFPGDGDETSLDEAESDEAEQEVEETSESDDKDQESDQETEGKGWLGFSLSGGKVSDLQLNSPATEAGLNDGDELIAINGIRIQGSLERRLKQFQVGDELELLVSRREVLSTVRLTIATKPKKVKWSLKRVSKPTDAQKTNLENWLSGSKSSGNEATGTIP